eukprot:scaffold336_cov196-Amphora_coffeaeformis.AAC.2
MFDPDSIESEVFGATSQKKRSDDILSKMFPSHVAYAVREGRTVEPENHECVTGFFPDIVSYTEISSTLSPAKVSKLLHRLYLKFDQLTEDFNVFKVETVVRMRRPTAILRYCHISMILRG